ncbi:monodehydroascorbate reductase, partial [Tanacetum coccineum]
TMADVNVNAPAEQAPAMAPPTRTDDQILPRIRWVPVGKSNCYLDVERSQSNPIYKIAVDILKNTNFFRAFIASSTIPSIYIQQFWDTVRYDKIAGCYRCQLDEQWFDLTKDTLRDALQITPVDTNNPFSSPPTPDALIKFVNDLGYPKVVRTLSDVVTNDMFQPWRALTTIINLCLTGKTSGFERPRAPVLQILWGVVNRAHIDYAERMFTKLIIYYLQSKHKFHPRPGSQLHLPNEEHVLGYLKFSAKGTKREVFGMPIPNDLITDDIRAKRSKAGKVTKKQKPKSSLQLIDEVVDEGVLDKEPLYGDEEADTQRAIEESLKEANGVHQGPLPPVVFREPDSGKFQPLPEVQVKGEEKVGVEQAAHDESSSLYSELGLTDSETESDEEVLHVIQMSQHQSSHVVHAGPNLEHMEFEVTYTSIQQNLEQMDEEFTTTAYPNVQENTQLKKSDIPPIEESKAGDTSSLNAVDWLFQAPLRDSFRDLARTT